MRGLASLVVGLVAGGVAAATWPRQTKRTLLLVSGTGIDKLLNQAARGALPELVGEVVAALPAPAGTET